MIKLVVGLGNPGEQYKKTRHNVGFLFLEQLANEANASWKFDGKFQASIAECSLATHKVVLLKPETFMNNSGQAVGQLARYYKLQPEHILVVHDELDFAAGVVKLKQGGGHAGHNGLRDIIAHLGSSDFTRLRIGINRPNKGKSVADYVLSVPSKLDAFAIEQCFILAATHLPQLIAGNISQVMNSLNTVP
jgi:PTH1 family peptidyl-tRNA hydrolase